jgi:hypothetical protein
MAHGRQYGALAPEYCPAAQFIHELTLPPAEYVPAKQSVQVYEYVPVDFLYCPAAHDINLYSFTTN